MNIPFRMFLQIEKQVGCMGGSGIKVVVKGTVVKQESDSIVFAVQLGCKAFDIIERGIDACNGCSIIDTLQVIADGYEV